MAYVTHAELELKMSTARRDSFVLAGTMAEATTVLDAVAAIRDWADQYLADAAAIEHREKAARSVHAQVAQVVAESRK